MPRIMWEATARRVLTMEWIDGVKLTDRERMAAKGLEVVDFVDVGVECTLRQLLDKGYFHAGAALKSTLCRRVCISGLLCLCALHRRTDVAGGRIEPRDTCENCTA